MGMGGCRGFFARQCRYFTVVKKKRGSALEPRRAKVCRREEKLR